jgi:hypothetical protein
MWVIADIAIARDGGPFGPGPDASTRFPARFDIDYVRMWSATSSQSTAVHTLEGIYDPVTPRPAASASLNAKMIKKAKPEYNKKALAGDQIFVTFGISE